MVFHHKAAFIQFLVMYGHKSLDAMSDILGYKIEDMGTLLCLSARRFHQSSQYE